MSRDSKTLYNPPQGGIECTYSTDDGILRLELPRVLMSTCTIQRSPVGMSISHPVLGTIRDYRDLQPADLRSLLIDLFPDAD